MFFSDFAVISVQASERFRLIARNLDTRDTQSESVSDARQRVQRGKLFGQPLSRAHLPEVVRVVRVLVVWTGCLSPA